MYNYTQIMYEKYIETCNANIHLSKEDMYFKSDEHYNAILEHVTKDFGDKYLNEIMNYYNTFYMQNKDYLIEICNQNDLYGKTKKEYFTDFTYCSPSNLRYILHSLLSLSVMYEESLNNINIIEIGGGYGGLCFFIKKLAPLFNITITSYTMFDLLPVSRLQEKYLGYLNDNANCYQLDNFNIEKMKHNSFLISNYAFSEISMSLQEEYIQKIINPYVSHGFLTWNAIPLYEFVENKTIIPMAEFPDTGPGRNNYNCYVKFIPK